MKALILAIALAAVTTLAPASAERDAQAQAPLNQATALVVADAGRLGATDLNALNANGSPWEPQGRLADAEFEEPQSLLAPGALFVALSLLAVALARPLGRSLRRQAQHRRAAALASTLGHTPRT